jgi:hypothetical protein
MIAVVMHALPPQFAELAGVQKRITADLLHARMPALVAEQSQAIANVPSEGLALRHE